MNKNIPILKNRESFVLSLNECARPKLMVKTVIEMANIFSWDGIARGIESYKVAYVLQMLGCSMVKDITSPNPCFFPNAA